MSIEKLSQEGITLSAECTDGRGHVNDLDQPSTYDGNIPMPIPVPMLVLVLRNNSFAPFDNEKDLNYEVFSHILSRIYSMNPGELTDYKGLFNPRVLDTPPLSTHLHVLRRMVTTIVAERVLPLEFAGFNSELHELYRRT